MRSILAAVVLVSLTAGCTHLEHTESEYDSTGKLTWKWETEAWTAFGMKSIEYVINKESEAAQLAGKGISNNFREVALRGIDTSPEFAAAIVRAFRPGGTLEGALAQLATEDPELGAKIRGAIADQEASEAAEAREEVPLGTNSAPPPPPPAPPAEPAPDPPEPETLPRGE
jgi:hypothetical protein